MHNPVLKFSASAAALLLLAFVSLSVSGAFAQVWSEPTATPPYGNTLPPIWNQDAADQTANFRISGKGIFGGNVGIKVANPGYALDVSGTVNAVGGNGAGQQGTSISSYGLYGISESGVGVGGVSLSGYGIYGASSGGYAGYFAGTLNATGAITQNGVAVCLADGTNCDSSGSPVGEALETRLTRGTVAYNADLAAKDALCVSEFGPGFWTASLNDVARSYIKDKTYQALTNSALGAYTIGNAYAYYGTTGGFSGVSAGSGWFNVNCVMKYRDVVQTRTTIPWNSTLAAKDAQCVTEFGDDYETSHILDVAKSWGGTVDHVYAVYAGMTTLGNTVAYWGGGSWYWTNLAISSGNYGVACRRK
jgi:hypothetical protein